MFAQHVFWTQKAKKITFPLACSLLLIAAICLASSPKQAQAVVNPYVSGYAWGENVGWINLGPIVGTTKYGVQVDSVKLTGYMWSENTGWINMDPGGGYGVSTNNGALRGKALSDNAGLISFGAEGANYGVTIDNNGNINGQAWGENIGWITFDLPSNLSTYEPTTGIDGWRPNQAPTVGAVTYTTPMYGKSGGTQQTQTITANYSDPNGYGDIKGSFLLIDNDGTPDSSSLYLFYPQFWSGYSSENVYVRVGSNWQAVTGSGYTVNDITVLPKGTTSSNTMVSSSGNNMTVYWRFKIGNSVSVSRNVYALVYDKSDVNTGYVNKGSITMYGNRKPNMPTGLTINNPPTIYATNYNSVTASASANDPDGESVSMQYYWRRTRGTATAEVVWSDQATLPSSLKPLYKNDVVRVWARAIDSYGAISDQTAEVNKTVQNSAPGTPTNLRFDQTVIYRNSTITVSADFADPDNDTITKKYLWSRTRGSDTVSSSWVTSASFPSSLGTLQFGDIIKVRAMGNDGTVDGAYTEQVPKTVQNRPPSTPTSFSLNPPVIYRNSPSTVGVTTGAQSNDLDGDSVTMYYYWRRISAGGNTDSGWVTSTSLPSLLTQTPLQVGDTIQVTAKGYDGIAYSDLVTTSKIVQNYLPVNVSVTPASGNYRGGIGLVQHFVATYSDSDGWGDLADLRFLINNTVASTDGCYVRFTPSSTPSDNHFYVYGTDPTTPWMDLGVVGQLVDKSSPSCTLKASSSRSNSSNNTIVTWDVVFADGWNKTGNLYMWGADSLSANSGWIDMGDANITANRAPNAPTGLAITSPATIYANSTNVTAGASATDPDGDSVTMQYYWRRIRSGVADVSADWANNRTVLPIGPLIKNDIVRVWARAVDMYGKIGAQTSDVSKTVQNSLPIITTTGLPTNKPEYVAYPNTQLTASDTVDNDTITEYQKVSGAWPSGITMSASGLISGTPGAGSAGTYIVGLQAKDSGGAWSNTATFSFQITSGNRAPSITSAPITTASENVLYRYDVDAADLDSGDSINYSLDVKPAGDMAIVPTTGVITWTPSYSQNGPHSVKARATDSHGLYAEQTFTINVGETNRAPVINNFSPGSTVSIKETKSQQFTVSASDPDDQNVTYKWKLNGQEVGSGTSYTYTPTAQDSGQKTVVVNASDGSLQTPQTWTVNVGQYPGDVDNNGVVNFMDVVMTHQIYRGLVQINATNNAADFNSSNSISFTEFYTVYQIFRGLVDPFSL